MTRAQFRFVLNNIEQETRKEWGLYCKHEVEKERRNGYDTCNSFDCKEETLANDT